MTIKELVTFLQNFNGDCHVRMVTCLNDNPLSDDLPIAKAVAIDSSDNDTYVVLFPG